MKRIRVFVLGLVVAVSLTACAENEEEVRQQIDLNTMQNEQALNYDTDTERNEQPVVEDTKIPAASDTKPEKETTNQEVSNDNIEQQEDKKPEKPAYSVKDEDIVMHAKKACSIYSEPSTEFDKIGSLVADQAIQVTGKTDNGWYRVDFCGNAGYIQESKLTVIKTPDPVPEVTPQPAPEVTPQPEQATETTQNQQDNYFYNDTNNYYDLNQVSIRPRYMYWDNGVLVAECFVINGLSVNVYNINVENLEFSNGSVKIAQAAFGVMQNAVIAPYSHVIWTFYFDTNCVLSANADLTGFMNCVSNTSYNY